MKVNPKTRTNLCRFLKEQPDIKFAFLFGSQVKEITDYRSDLDIAVFLSPNKGLDREAMLSLDLRSKIVKILDSEKLDLIILNTCPLEIAKEVCFEGELLTEKNTEDRIEWEISIIKKWWDWEPRLREWNEAFSHRLKEVSGS